MSIVAWLKNKTIHRKIYWFDLLCKVKGYKSERLTKKIVKTLKDIDPIQDYENFSEKIWPLLQSKQYLAYASCGAESLHYGHLNALYEYAGADKKVNPMIFPAMEHAVAYGHIKRRNEEEIKRNLSFIYQSRYRKAEIHAVNKWKPVFCIGPYIHYAKSYYNEEELKNLKRKYGKVLTVFAAHNREDQTLEYNDQELVDFVMDYAKENSYDTVLVSVYFADVDKAIYKNFQERGAVLISAGFREDFRFINRLKSIFLLSDMVMANNVGSPIGFCYYLNIPYMMVAKLAKRPNDEILFQTPISVENHMISRKKLSYLSTLEKMSKEEKEVYNELYLYFSGERELTKSPQEIRAMIDVMNLMMKRTKGIYVNYDKAVQELLVELNKDSLEYKMLKEAIED